MQHDLVLDTFCGTGGLLVPAGVLGAMCFGSDIDYRVLQGTGVGRVNKKSSYYKANEEGLQEKRVNMKTNFQQYGLPEPNLVQFDVTQNRLARGGLFDSIICDPPYGVRACVKQTGLKTYSTHDEEKQAQVLESMNKAINSEDSAYFPATKKSEVNQLVDSLFQVADQLLRPAGRLVFLYPWFFHIADNMYCSHL